MTGLIIVLAFLALGLVVVVVAMSGGPRAATRKTLGSPSRSNTRTVGVAAGAVIAFFGIAVPALTFGLTDESDAPAGLELTATQVEGRELFNDNCSNCHILAASNAVGRVGPNLDLITPDVDTTLAAIDKGFARGAGQMPADVVEGENARAVAEYVAAVAGRVR